MSWSADRRCLLGLGLWGVLATPPLRTLLEASMPATALQLVLLVASGWLMAAVLGPLDQGGLWGTNRFGLTGFLIGLMTVLIWLLPISLDRALDRASWEIGKFVSLPLLGGVALGRSWPRLPGLARGVLWANLIPMLAVMGWLYYVAPVRLCNNYLVDDQRQLGLLLWVVAAVTAAYWSACALIGFPRSHGENATRKRG